MPCFPSDRRAESVQRRASATGCNRATGTRLDVDPGQATPALNEVLSAQWRSHRRRAPGSPLTLREHSLLTKNDTTNHTSLCARIQSTVRMAIGGACLLAC